MTPSLTQWLLCLQSSACLLWLNKGKLPANDFSMTKTELVMPLWRNLVDTAKPRGPGWHPQSWDKPPSWAPWSDALRTQSMCAALLPQTHHLDLNIGSIKWTPTQECNNWSVLFKTIQLTKKKDGDAVPDWKNKIKRPDGWRQCVILDWIWTRVKIAKKGIIGTTDN